MAYWRIVAGEDYYGAHAEKIKTHLNFHGRQVRIKWHGHCGAGDADNRQRSLRSILHRYGDTRVGTKSRTA